MMIMPMMIIMMMIVLILMIMKAQCSNISSHLESRLAEVPVAKSRSGACPEAKLAAHL